MKKEKKNVLVFDICNIPQQRDLILQTFNTSPDVSYKIVINFKEKHNPSMINLGSKTKQKVAMNDAIIGKPSKSQTPPFFSTFEIFNHDVHNCLVDSRSSSNVIPFLICSKINDTPTKCANRIIQLDRSNVKVIREHKDILIRVYYNPKVYQIISIMIVDILESYGIFLTRDWS